MNDAKSDRRMSGEREGTGLQGNSLFICLVVSLLINFVLGLTIVWVNTERTTLGYDLRALQQRYAEEAAYSTKLEMERDRHLSPYNLEKKAREFGMAGAKPGQIRRMD